MDVVSINRYYGWYDQSGHISAIRPDFSNYIESWYATRKKPMVITEYGAGAVAGLHKVRMKATLYVYITFSMSVI